jgi:peroxiredoxin
MRALAIRLAWLLGLMALGQAGAQPEHPANPQDIAPLLPGEALAAGVSVRAADGSELDLSAKLAAGRHIVIFYRGGWCPYCNKHLGELAELESQFVALGYDILAISPDRPERVAEVSKLLGAELEATLLSDSSMQAASAFGLAFRVSDELVAKYREYGIDLEVDSGQTHHLLPVPAAYVFVDGVVQFQYANPDYKTRVPGQLLLAAARIAAASLASTER